MASQHFRLNSSLDVERLAQDFASERRLHIPDFLADESARELHESLLKEQGWELTINQGKAPHFFQPTTLTAQRKEQLVALSRMAAPDSLHYSFERIVIPDGAQARAGSSRAADQFAGFLSSEPVLSLLRRIVGAEAVTFADAMATAYGPGDFLELHDDAGDPKQNRHAAYVFNLTPSWQVDWGGLLLFRGTDGHIERGFAPSFNALNLFEVPQRHWVSQVTSAAKGRRYSITGWLRSGTPPE